MAETTWNAKDTIIVQSESGRRQGEIAESHDGGYDGTESTHGDKEKIIDWAKIWPPIAWPKCGC